MLLLWESLWWGCSSSRALEWESLELWWDIGRNGTTVITTVSRRAHRWSSSWSHRPIAILLGCVALAEVSLVLLHGWWWRSLTTV